MRSQPASDAAESMAASALSLRFFVSAGIGAPPLRIAVLAPPWIPVPPPGYGGIEAVVGLLSGKLVERGHDVTLFAAPGSRSTARLHPLLDAAHPDAVGSSLHESDHVARAWEEIELAAERGEPFDVVHDHSGFTAVAMADRVEADVVHTIHGPLDPTTGPFYRRHGHKARLVAISRSQAASAPNGVQIAAVVPNPIAVDRWPLREHKRDYLLWVGRMDPVKGAHRAIAAARLAARTLVLAGPVLMPVRWREPFGMVMVEALACGTPVIAFPEGAATEIVIDGENGTLVSDEAGMARAVRELASGKGERTDPLT